MTAAAPELVLLYDGLCRYCNAMVRFILARDRGGTMRFAPLQGEFARGILARHPELRGTDSLILVERAGAAGDERITMRSEAVLRIWSYVGGWWRAINVLRIVPRPLRDWGYDLFAGLRYRLFGRFEACPMPSPEGRARFIE